MIAENERDPTKTRIEIEYIDGCLTSVYQPCDIVVNRSLKTEVRLQYAQQMRNFPSKPGDKMVVTREDLVGFIENATNKINNDQIRGRTIASAFNTCGVNPYATEEQLKIFENHLTKLSRDGELYKSLLKQNEHILFGKILMAEQ
ncbi:MAG: hypothetical protein ACREOZ_04490 [Gloeomargaritales cyanobacterium]